MTVSVSWIEVSLRVVMPVAIIVASAVIYLALTQPYNECVAGRAAIQNHVGPVDQALTKSYAQFECYTKR